MRTRLVGLSAEEIISLCVERGYTSYRGKQISDWIYTKHVSDGSKMTNLPKDIKEWLTKELIGFPNVKLQTKSADGTTKCLLALEDGETIECVLLPYNDRVSLCISTQVGCPMGCLFCATGSSGLERNLTCGEIVGQYLSASNLLSERISHVVMMGMGEPLLNTENVLKSISIFEKEIGLSARNITISTIGIPQEIRNLAQHKLQCTLAVSLHSVNQQTRSMLMPAVKKYTIQELLDACKYYTDITHRRLTFEYLMIDKINDSLEDARNMIDLLRGLLCHVNLIPYNYVPGCNFKRSSKTVIAKFKNYLEAAGISVTQRQEKGSSKDSACGQLRRTTKARIC